MAKNTVSTNKFYKIQREELLELRKSKAINNTAFVYFALKLEHPYCDRQLEIQVPEFCLSWGMPESSLYRAIAALHNREVINIESRTILVNWAKIAETPENSLSHSQQAEPSNNREFILRSENEFSDLRKEHIYSSRARSKDSLDYLDSPLTPQGENLEGGEKNDLEEEQKEGGEKKGSNQELEVSEKSCSLVEEITELPKEVSNSAKGGFPAAALLKKGYKRQKAENQDFPIALDHIPQPLLRQAERLGIKFDNEVVAAFKEYHESQIGAALNGMDEYEGEIHHPKSFFLSKVAKQPRDVVGMRQPLYTNDWMHKPAEPCPGNIKNQINGLMEKLIADKAMAKARRNC